DWIEERFIVGQELAIRRALGISGLAGTTAVGTGLLGRAVPSLGQRMWPGINVQMGGERIAGNNAAAFERYKAYLAQQEIANANRVGSALQSDPLHRAPTFVIDDICNQGTVFRIRGGDGVERTLTQMPGSVNGQAGVFEWIVDQNGSLVHQRFIPGGPVSGIPNIRPPQVPQ